MSGVSSTETVCARRGRSLAAGSAPKKQLRTWHSWAKPREHSPGPSVFPTAPRGREHPCRGRAHGASSGGAGHRATHTRALTARRNLKMGFPPELSWVSALPRILSSRVSGHGGETASRLSAGAACVQARCQTQTRNVGAHWTFPKEHLDPTVPRTGSQLARATAESVANAFGQTQSPAPDTVSPGLPPAGNTASPTAVPTVRSLPGQSLSPPNKQ